MVDESLIENPLMSPPIPFLIEEWIDFSTDQSNFDCVSFICFSIEI